MDKAIYDVICAVISERKRQDDKWGEQNHLAAWWIVILAEEFGEAARAVLEGDWFQYHKELIQIAAVAIAAAESYARDGGMMAGKAVPATCGDDPED